MAGVGVVVAVLAGVQDAGDGPEGGFGDLDVHGGLPAGLVPKYFQVERTGGGKTATASVPAAHVRANGWLVDIIDPKRRSYLDRKTGLDVLTNVSGIPVHTDIESMMWALKELFLSMLGVNIAIGERNAWPGAFPARLLVIDEFGTFAGMAARMHRRAGGTGPSPALDQRRQIEWQGRQAGHRLVVAVHQPNLRLFGDSDSRGQYGYRLITGAYTSSLWRMTFGFGPGSNGTPGSKDAAWSASAKPPA